MHKKTASKGISETDLLRGRRLQAARVEAGLSTDQMAAIIDKAVSTVRTYERGEFEPSASALIAWAETTKKTVGWLLGQVDVAAEADNGKGVVVTMTEELHPGHPGVEQLAQDDDLRREERITDQEITELRQLRGKWANGQSIIIQTRAQALDWLRTLRASRPFPL